MDRNSPTRELENAVDRFFKSGAYPSLDGFLDRFIDHLEAHCLSRCGRMVCESVGIAISTAAGQLYLLAGFTGELTRLTDLDAVEHGQYRDHLLAVLALQNDPERRLWRFIYALIECFDPLLRALPAPAFAANQAEKTVDISVPLIELLPEPAAIVEAIQYPIFRQDPLDDAFRNLRAILDANGEAIATEAGKVVMPTDHPGDAQEIVRAYLWDTPFLPIFDARVPFEIPLEDRGEHTAIVAGAGWGKTQLLQTIIAGDLEGDDPPALVVIDSTGAMVRRIEQLAVFNSRLKDRLVIINPELDPVPALNPFDVSNPRFSAYDANVREQMQGEIIDLFNYVFSTINNPLTTRMQTAFAFMVRLLISIPGANIHTLLQLLDDDPAKGDYSQAVFKPSIDNLDPTTQHFFKAQYYTGRDGGLREQIRARVFDILRVPAFERMFSTVNKIDFFTELNRGSIILVNTSEALLKEGSATFGRYIIARVMAAAFERAPIPPEKRNQAFLIVDEAAPYFDETFEKLLNRVRQFKLGVVIAFQNLEQANEKLRSTIASSTAIKYAGGTGANDARWLSREMRSEAEFIMSQKRDARPPKWTQFACYVRNFTDRAVSLTVPFFTIENMPKMSDAEHAALMERNRARVAAPREPVRQATPAPPLRPLPQQTPVEALAKAYPDLATARAALERAIKDMDWAKAGGLEHSIIPALEREVAGTAEPKPVSPSDAVPTLPNDERRGATEADTTWR